jgi:hypothetical protein
VKPSCRLSSSEKRMMSTTLSRSKIAASWVWKKMLETGSAVHAPISYPPAFFYHPHEAKTA